MTTKQTTKNGPATQAMIPQPPAAGQIARQEFGASQMAVQAETASTAVAAQAQAAVQARWIMALQRPRNMDQVRYRVLHRCKAPEFAEVARYRKPIGAGVEGPSIRFVEAVIREMGNILVETPVVYDDREKRILRVMATDLETNATYQEDVVIEKLVERKNSRDRTVVGTRLNSKGETVYLVEATDDELMNKANALKSKAIRTVGLRLIPGELTDEAQDVVIATRTDKAAKDPDGERKRLVDAFAAVGVLPAELAKYIGHDLGTCAPKELVELRSVYTAVRDGETTWRAVWEERFGQKAETAPASVPKAGAAAVRASLGLDPNDDIPADFGASAMSDDEKRAIEADERARKE